MKLALGSVLIGLIVLGVAAGDCQAQSLTTTETGLLGGAAVGAGTGAIVGAAVHHPGKGALIGGGIGAVTGGLVGHEMQNQQDAQYRLERRVAAQQRQIDRQRLEIDQLEQSEKVE